MFLNRLAPKPHRQNRRAVCKARASHCPPSFDNQRTPPDLPRTRTSSGQCRNRNWCSIQTRRFSDREICPRYGNIPLEIAERPYADRRDRRDAAQQYGFRAHGSSSRWRRQRPTQPSRQKVAGACGPLKRSGSQMAECNASKILNVPETLQDLDSGSMGAATLLRRARAETPKHRLFATVSRRILETNWIGPIRRSMTA